MKKLILIMLVLVMVVSVFASCGNDKTPTTTPQATTKKPVVQDDETPENEKMNLDLDSIDYDNEEVHIFHWEIADDRAEFGMELDDINNDAVKDATYKRNSYTETDLGITLDWYKQSNSNYPKSTQFVDKLDARKQDPNTPVDLVAGCVRSMPFFMVDGHLTELNTYSDSLDLTKTWWPENIQDAIAVKDNLYFVSGDISPSTIRNMTVLFVNKTILESNGQNYVELMEQIKAYEWTLDDLIRLTEGQYQDLDTIAGPSAGDKYGLITLYFHSDALYTGLGYKYGDMSSKDNQVIRLASQLAGETAANYVQKMKDWQLNNDFYMKYLDPQEATFADSFLNGNALFVLNTANFGFEIQKTDIKYAVLPTPALDLNQKRYYTNMNSSYSAYGICDASTDYDRAAQTMQVLGYYAYLNTTPAIFEISFQGKFSKDDYTIEMFDIIRESIVFDTGRVYDVYIASIAVPLSDWTFLEYILPNIVSYGIKGNEQGEDTNFNFPSSGDPMRRAIQKCIDQVNEKILTFLDSQA
jgi:ABC-type glycerol-3-phosphate transport system substrate-binding protein